MRPTILSSCGGASAAGRMQVTMKADNIILIFPKGGGNMAQDIVIQNMIMLFFLFLLFCVAFLHLATLLCTKVPDSINWLRYKGQGRACIVSVEKADVTVSRRMVKEKKDGKKFAPIKETLDKNVAYPPFTFRMRRKYYLVLEWKVGDKTFQANYPYYQKVDRWKQGEKVDIRYSVQKPWKYSIQDLSLWKASWVLCLIDLGLIAAGILMTMSMIS